jgi:nucleotide-binding universal stress UspA family protein
MPTRSPNARTLEAALRQQHPVVCAVDDDDLAAEVLASAAVIAAQLTVPLIVVHSPSSDVFVVGEERRAALDRADAFLDDLTVGHTVDERVVELNDPIHLVVDVAAEGATMIVIGSRRRTGLRAALLGSVSQSVIGGADCPVLVVAPPEPDVEAAPALATRGDRIHHPGPARDEIRRGGVAVPLVRRDGRSAEPASVGEGGEGRPGGFCVARWSAAVRGMFAAASPGRDRPGG